MTIPTNPAAPFSPFLSAFVQIPEDPERLRTYLQEKLSTMADISNDKVIGAFTQEAESFNGEKWSYDTTKKIRNGYQVIARITSFVPQTIPLPVGNVNPQFIMTLVYGTASLPCTAVGANDGVYFSFFSQGDVRIQFTVSDTEIVITTNGTTANYQGFIVLQYVRDGI